ncbi:MAG: hypothetical protein ACE5IY_12455 [bacterium]
MKLSQKLLISLSQILKLSFTDENCKTLFVHLDQQRQCPTRPILSPGGKVMPPSLKTSFNLHAKPVGLSEPDSSSPKNQALSSKIALA